jgi:two-component system KDP operon response regulator KdpE
MNEIPSRVLVVDDEIQIRRFLRTGFELDGFTVQEAETGTEALRSATLRVCPETSTGITEFSEHEAD